MNKITGQMLREAFYGDDETVIPWELSQHQDAYNSAAARLNEILAQEAVRW